MSAVRPVESVGSEPLTWAQICEEYPDQWVCLVEIGWENDTDFAFSTARVVGHGKTRREPLDQAKALWTRYQEIGHFFTGPIRRPSPYSLV